MPSYRVNYVGRSSTAPGAGAPTDLPNFMTNRQSGLTETEFEDELQATSPAQALEAFFGEHVERREDVKMLGADGRSHPIEGVADYNPRSVYLWIEDGMMMEYQGIEEMTPGKAICPMCNGSGEIDESLADSYADSADRKNTGA
ncbi:MAG TPA: hypothetical protein VIP09_13750 [Dehalococcoidia bacterium]